jgi:methyl-accepting chemotaxis protein
MEEMNTTVQQNDENSQHANDLAAGAAKAAEHGGQVVGKVTRTMQEIDVSSKKIAEIISVIDSIAFQTNILALNAAVEAARAGEQGRGFAVVATEVRALAQRSAEAAKEIRTLIGESVKKVQAGTREAMDSGKAMDEILTAARKVEETMGQIRISSQDQRQGIAQVSHAVEQMNRGTQQSAAMVEEISATADMLREQAEQLLAAVSVFKVGSDDVLHNNDLDFGRDSGIADMRQAAPQPNPAGAMHALPMGAATKRTLIADKPKR